ncbi:polysaccharide deacetylase family protein [Polaromonas jejuensis]|uniref:Polysaccharide deacetylase family protein n=1 Tax=Polaromonas jejuensis TaxID=457502 RepID=A0ABW0QFS7_9BURK|nr:polysaccharide deacetylase family protein [Polaromonas jejuensis]
MTFSEIPGVPTTRTANHGPIPILVYHQIAEAPPKGSPFRSLYVAPKAFARQMAWLKLLGYKGLSMGDLEPYLRGERTGKVVGITFDDGYQNNLTHALPVLVKHGFSSTCYAVSGLLGKTNVWDEAVGIAQTPLMTEAEVRQWVSGGQEIGSHTRQHVNLLASDHTVSQQEMALGKTELESVIGQPVRHFCYPYGHYAPKHVTMAAGLGFVTATTTQRSRCHAQTDLLQIPRVPVLRSTSLPVFWLKIATAYEDRRKK